MNGKPLSTFVAVLVYPEKIRSGTDFMQIVKHMPIHRNVQQVGCSFVTFSLQAFQLEPLFCFGINIAHKIIICRYPINSRVNNIQGKLHYNYADSKITPICLNCIKHSSVDKHMDSN